MGSLYLGKGAAVGMGFEGTWGTPVAITNWFRLLSGADPERAPEKVARNALQSNAAIGTQLGHFTTNDFAGGSFQILAGYTSIGAWFRAIFGSAADAGGGPFTHTYTPGDFTTIPLTLEFCNPYAGPGGSGMSEVYAGCLINKGRFHVGVGEQAVLQVDEFFARTTGGIVAAGSPSFGSTDTIVHHFQAGTWTWNAVAYTIRSFDLVFDNGLARRQQLGSQFTSQPTWANPRSWKVSITLEVQDALTTAYYADTQPATSTLAFTESGSVDMTWTMQNSYIESMSRPIASHGMILQTVNLCCESDGASANGISVAVKNAVATSFGGIGRY